MWREATRYDLAFQEKRLSEDFFEFGRSGRVYSRNEVISTDSREIGAVLPLANLSVRLWKRIPRKSPTRARSCVKVWSTSRVAAQSGRALVANG